VGQRDHSRAGIGHRGTARLRNQPHVVTLLERGQPLRECGGIDLSLRFGC